jgi:hypothetical protein
MIVRETNMSLPSPQIDCALGRHLPRYKHRDVTSQTVQRSACRACGVSIIKLATGRRWIVSGLLG